MHCDVAHRHGSWFGVFFIFKQKTAYEVRISDWSSDVCSSDLRPHGTPPAFHTASQSCFIFSVSGWGLAGYWILGQSILCLPSWFGRCTEIGRASCRGRVCQYVYISVVAVSLKKKMSTNRYTPYPPHHRKEYTHIVNQ